MRPCEEYCKMVVWQKGLEETAVMVTQPQRLPDKWEMWSLHQLSDRDPLEPGQNSGSSGCVQPGEKWTVRKGTFKALWTLSVPL